MTYPHGVEFDEFRARAETAAAAAAAGLAREARADLEAAYRAAIRFVFGVLATLVAESREIGQAAGAFDALTDAAHGAPWRKARDAVAELGKSSGLGIIGKGIAARVPAGSACAAARALLAPERGTALGPVYLSTIPAGWLSLLYERLLGLRPRPADGPPGVALMPDAGARKRSGSFFTPPYLVTYIVSRSLGRVENPSAARVLDPSMGAGDFLLRALEFLARGSDPAGIAENCLYGCDIDPIAVDIARFLVWLEAGGRADARRISRHLVCADALAGDGSFRWQKAFPDAFSLFSGRAGFDAVIGNPPYIAAKNQGLKDLAVSKRTRGQSDYYLLFLESVMDNELVRPGGSLAMVLPDPFLVRNNAAHIRKRLLTEWKIEEVVHVAGAFPGASVANVIPVCAKRNPDGAAIPVVRLDRAQLRHRFEADPGRTMDRFARRVRPDFALAQPRSEVLYLVEGEWQVVFERIHGPKRSLSRVRPPFVRLEDIGVAAIFRGEEIGKSAIASSDGDLPILLGGESVRRYGIDWEGRRIRRDAVSKPMEWYSAPKILLQKSSARLVAALDTAGYIVPQSVYGIKLADGACRPLYVLALLNSTFLSEYTFRAFTGYKLVQPQIELEDVRRLPVRMLPSRLSPEEAASLADRALQVFETGLRERSREFPALAAIVDEWLGSGQEDAAEPLLVALAGFASRLRNEKNVQPDILRRVDRAIDVVVDRLYR